MSSVMCRSYSHIPLTIKKEDFIFTSPHKSLLAKGIFANLTLPAEQGHRHNSEFQRQIDQLLIQATRAGIKNPIIAGVIPFDKRHASALYIPQSYQWFDRHTLALPNTPVNVIGQLHQYLDHNDFCSMVKKALCALHGDTLDKVVLSRLLNIESIKPLNALSIWCQLHKQNPSSYNFYLPLSDCTLVGASPELLLRKQGDKLWSCPLAGTAKRGENSASDNLAKETLLTSSKDRYEHELVTKAIHHQLSAHCQDLTIPVPSLISTPKLWHLATEIEGLVKDKNESAISLACLLHPTPALCGTPSMIARDLITQLEPFDRQWFGGIIGWSDAEGNGEWVVVIRCGKVSTYRIELFAGAGIVPDSQPENEWCETSNKLGTMLSALNYQPC